MGFSHAMARHGIGEDLNEMRAESAVEGSSVGATRRQTLRQFGGGALLAAVATAGLGGKVFAQTADATPTAGNTGVGEGVYVVFRTWTFKPEKSAEELAALVREGFVPLVRETPGFREYFNVWNAETRQWTAVSIFVDKAGAEESTVRAKDWAAAHVAEYVGSDPTVVDGQIILFAGEDEPV
ncbi:MAG: hypothetical protein QOG89_74 [Thermomicrobiales bacterium]|nr:hypothetical protein [Thermomicrobiales bacterium]